MPLVEAKLVPGVRASREAWRDPPNTVECGGFGAPVTSHERRGDYDAAMAVDCVLRHLQSARDRGVPRGSHAAVGRGATARPAHGAVDRTDGPQRDSRSRGLGRAGRVTSTIIDSWHRACNRMSVRGGAPASTFTL